MVNVHWNIFINIGFWKYRIKFPEKGRETRKPADSGKFSAPPGSLPQVLYSKVCYTMQRESELSLQVGGQWEREGEGDGYGDVDREGRKTKLCFKWIFQPLSRHLSEIVQKVGSNCQQRTRYDKYKAVVTTRNNDDISGVMSSRIFALHALICKTNMTQ